MNEKDGMLVILAGGRSRRMGRDKTFLPCHGTTFLQYLISRAERMFDRICVAAGSLEHAELVRRSLRGKPVTVIADRYDRIGPMGGLLSVFEQTQAERFVTVAVDIPEADMQVLQMLWKEAGHVCETKDTDRPPCAAVMFSLPGTGIEPCAAAYNRLAYERMLDAARREEYSMRRALGPDTIRILDLDELKRKLPGISLASLRRAFRNINTPEDLGQITRETAGRPEILAPAGNWDAMCAAVNAGCDAVYLAGQLFGARAYAGNFSQEELLKAIDHCHLFGVRVYMTVNTLLKDPEIDRLVSYMEPYYLAGLDGVIVQDVGVIRVLRQAFPDLPLHGSTQMSITSSCGAALLREQGLTRVVPARELTLPELKEILREVEIEIETFVHGAMCYAYSGKCLLSSFAGGRSGNRGRCAQPCRQMYDMGNGVRSYSLSMKDMCTLPILPELIDAGIHSFKIEGRMKKPVYVASAVAAYRKAADAYLSLREQEKAADWTGLSEQARAAYQRLSRELSEQLMDVYNRGFCTGYYHADAAPGTSSGMISRERPNHAGVPVGTVEGVKGPEITVRLIRKVHAQDVLEILPVQVELTAAEEQEAGGVLHLKGREIARIRPGMEVVRTRNNHLLRQIEQQIVQKERSISGKAVLEARIGQPLSITITSADHITARVQGGLVETAAQRPVSAEVLTEKMKKTKGTSVELQVECLVDEQAFFPMRLLNELRRSAIEAYKDAVLRPYRRNRVV